MRWAGWVVVAGIVLGVAAIAWRLDRSPTPVAALATMNASSSAATTPMDAAPAPTDLTASSDGPPPVNPVSAADWRARMHRAADYHELLQDLLAAAEANDPEAQYVLANKLHECDDAYRFYFDRGARRRTLDEALLWASTKPGIDMDDIRRMHARCDALMVERSRYGDSLAWRQRAASLGHAAAQATLVGDLLMSARADRPDSEAASARLRATGVLQSVVASGDPDVLWEIGELQHALRGDVPGLDYDAAAWGLAACRLGYECGETARWVRQSCHFDPNRQCQPGDGVDELMKRYAPSDYPEFDRRAQRIVGLVRSGDADELRRVVVDGLGEQR